LTMQRVYYFSSYTHGNGLSFAMLSTKMMNDHKINASQIIKKSFKKKNKKNKLIKKLNRRNGYKTISVLKLISR